VCVAADGQALLAAQLSSYFNASGTYFAVFEFPALDRPYEEVPAKDGYFGQILGKRAATEINNCLAYIEPEFIILLGISEVAQTYLRAMLPQKKLLTVNTESELLSSEFTANAPEPLKCKPSQVIEGLVAAKLAKRPLAFAEDAADIPAPPLLGKEGLTLLENSQGVDEVSIINYATSIDADIVIAEAVKREQLQLLPRQLQAWAADHSSPALREIRRKITERVKGIDFKRYKFATFFTSGLPYGLILQNVIPFTHVLNGPYCGRFIANAIVEESSPQIGSALLFSLDEFSSDETKDIAQLLDQNNFVVTSLVGPAATNENLTNYGSNLPYDLLHICSHGGETDGYFVKQEFKDRDGNPHTLEYFEVVSFSLELAADPDKVLVERKMIFVALDNVAWTDRPLSMYPRYVGDDMMQALRNDDKNLKRMPVADPIALSCHIKCYQSFHQGAFNHLASHAHPVIFNNSCSSSHELAASFLSTGARCYIGTLWNVGNQTAMNAAITFHRSVLDDGSVLRAFSSMLRSVSKDLYRNIYIAWGLHFTSLARPATKSDDNVIAGLAANYFTWMRKLATTKEDEVRKNILPILQFLRSELKRRLSAERLQQMLAGMIPEQDEIERSQNFTEQGEGNELTLAKEVYRSEASGQVPVSNCRKPNSTY
jgi:hypothetical protein